MASWQWRRLLAQGRRLACRPRKSTKPLIQARSQTLFLEILEARLAPAVSADLIGGVLDIALDAPGDSAVVLHPAGSIRVTDAAANTVVSDFSDTLVKSIDAH